MENKKLWYYENMLQEVEWTIHVGQMKSGKRTMPSYLTTQAQKEDRNKA
jgi:hypothetical protein